jgi:hypothetical protein
MPGGKPGSKIMKSARAREEIISRRRSDISDVIRGDLDIEDLGKRMSPSEAAVVEDFVRRNYPEKFAGKDAK